MDILSNIVNQSDIIGACVACCLVCCCCIGCCQADLHDGKNFATWIALMYRFVVSLTFSSICLHITIASSGVQSDELKVWCIILLVLTLVVPWALSFLNFVTLGDEANSARQNLTLDRSAANLASGGLNEVQDLKLFGMNIDTIFADDHDFGNQKNILLAARDGASDALRVLLDNGADIDITDENGDTPLVISCNNEQIECMAILIERSKDFDVNALLMLAAKNNKAKSITYLMDEFPTAIDAKDKDGWTLLMRAAWNGSIDVVQSLISNYKDKIDINAQNNGKTALSWAIIRNHQECVELLRSNGAK